MNDNTITIGPFTSPWIGNLKLKNLLVSKKYTIETVGIDNQFSGYSPAFYAMSSFFVRKHNNILEFAGPNKYRTYTCNYLLIKDADIKYNFTDFDWIHVYGADIPPTQKLISKFNFHTFSTSYISQLYNNTQVVKEFSNTNILDNDVITFGNCTVLPTLGYTQCTDDNCINYIKTLEYKNKNVFSYESNKIGFHGHLGYISRQTAFKYGLKNQDMCEFMVYNVKELLPKDISYPEHLFINGNIPILEIFKKYKYLMDIGGGGFMGRLIYLINSNRVLFYTKPERFVCSYADHFLQKNKFAYIPMDIPLSTLREEYEKFENDNTRYEMYRNNLRSLADKYFTYDNLLDYIYKVFKFKNII